MRFYLYGLSLFVVLAPVIRSVGAAERVTQITWAKNHAPPFFISTGPNAGRGFADGVQAMLEQALPRVEHKTVYMPLPRLNDMWQKQANYCFASMIFEPLPADTHYVLSQPNMTYLPHGVIARRNFPPADGTATVSLEELLKNRDLVLGSIRNRTYGATIDALMAEHQHAPQEVLNGDRGGLQRLLEMLILERIDYLIDYAFVYEYYRQQPEFEHRLQLLPVEETRGESVLGAIGCTNNMWGKTAIAEINRALNMLLPMPAYREFIANWQAVGMDQKHYWQTFEAERRSLDGEMAQ